MARGVNKVILVGNLGNDPDMKYTAGGAAIARVSVATTDSWKDKQSGENQERTEWHRVVFFGRLAEIVGEYLRKGSQIYLEGRLQTNKWQDQNGQDRYTTEIIANEMQMLGARGGESAPRQQPSQSGSGGFRNNPPAQQAPSQQAPSQQAPSQQAPSQQAPSQPGRDNDFADDDIPF